MTISQATFLKALTTASLVLTLGACQTKAPPPVSDNDIAQFSQATEAKALSTIVSLKNCMSLGGELGSEAKSIYQSWFNDHGKLVEASERYLQKSRNDLVEWQGLNFSLISVKNYHDTLLAIKNRQNLANRGPEARHDICTNVYSNTQSYAPSAGNERVISALYERVNISNKAEAGMFVMSDLLPAFPAPGKSFYQVTQSLQPHCAQTVEIVTLMNDWPIETYASYCDNSGLALLQCEWGKCTKQLPTDAQI
ncbi:hypothetical protein QWI17_03900 [Gilvimarinus sp. SDUM040013]|uniref:Lipoprotein n=1 Tax=Gilvimarinus gilvus TaxID=3058038 RepID=A0ABU4S529_9GAMM|nr:hypothetical protein [Gilvimarinus sp. SDUM040013]MDO3384980.1 hypothetical protein [Gilvimarinus sp. SDUM040013]MDX6851501.1 hypothetical protein [Gilvimarinus sp. SDUM040013]